ncbi:hypothetical protein F5X97DRAFT_305496, partial [Nemania serpens]
MPITVGVGSRLVLITRLMCGGCPECRSQPMPSDVRFVPLRDSANVLWTSAIKAECHKPSRLLGSLTAEPDTFPSAMKPTETTGATAPITPATIEHASIFAGLLGWGESWVGKLLLKVV